MPSPPASGRGLEDYQARKCDSRGNEGRLHLTHKMDDLEDQKDVDLAIFDFITYKALDAVFEWRARPNHHESDLPDVLVEMTNGMQPFAIQSHVADVPSDWLEFLKHKHGQHLHGQDHSAQQTNFRARLLQFCSIFAHRLDPGSTFTTDQSLSTIRADQETRYSCCRNSSVPPAIIPPFNLDLEFPLQVEDLIDNHHQLAAVLGVPSDKHARTEDVDRLPSLSDLLPLFMQLTASRVRLGDWLLDEDWYNLAAEWMLQAVIEQYLCCGAAGNDTFNTIFAYGCPGEGSQDASEPDWIRNMHILFCNGQHPHSHNRNWPAIRREYINELLPDGTHNMSLVNAFQNASGRYPISLFEDKVMAYLAALHSSVDKPDLVQAEQREITINGKRLSKAEADDMLERIGL